MTTEPAPPEESDSAGATRPAEAKATDRVFRGKAHWTKRSWTTNLQARLPMAVDEPRTILITGVMAAGKSTVAELVAERLPRSVHLRGDVFRRMIVNGRASFTGALSSEAVEQLRLRYSLAAAAAEGYLRAGFSVVYQDVILGKYLEEVLRLHAGRPLHVVVLCPTPAAVTAREAARGKVGYRGGITVGELDRALREHTPRVGLWLDSSLQSAAETADRIIADLEAARV